MPKTDSESFVQISPLPKPALLPGYTIDKRFLIIRNLYENNTAEKGGIGLVYLAEDLNLLGKEVVIKVLQEASLKNEDLVRKFKHEKEALIRIDHPNIVKILDSGILSDGNPYLVMDYISGYSLRRVLLENKNLSFEFCAHILESVTNAISAAHSKKILHRDLKPENIMLTPKAEGFEHVRLIDFGIARVGDSKLAPATQTERGIGTVLYMAPEQLSGQLNQTPAVDIYACAVIAYEMLTGKLPFISDTTVEMYLLQMQGIKIRPREIRPEIPESAEMLILQALAFDPMERHKDVRVFGQTLANVLRQAGAINQDKININKYEDKDLFFQSNSQFDKEMTDSSSSGSILTEIYEPTKCVVSADKTNRSTRLLWLALGILILAGTSLLIGLISWTNSGNFVKNKNSSNYNLLTSSNNEKISDAPDREFSFYLNVQKMRNGKPFEEPFRATGREIFESGYKFKMVLKSNTDGYFYLFNEGKNEQSETAYYILYPTSKQKNSGQIKASREITTGYNLFSGGKGTEIIWIIWTKQEIVTLETAKKSAVERSGGVLKEEETHQLNNFLQKYDNGQKDISKNNANQLTTIKAKGDVIIHRVELEHK